MSANASARHPTQHGPRGHIAAASAMPSTRTMRDAAPIPRIPALMVLATAAACYSPNLPSSSDETGGSDTTTSDGSWATQETGPGEASSLDSNPMPTSDAGSPTIDVGNGDTSTTNGGCIDAGDCALGEVCVDAICGPCDAAVDPDGACADASPSAPYCDGPAGCAACTAAVCTGETPACSPSLGCVACTEHAQCPESACHLMGPDAGSCFQLSDVVDVSDAVEFQAEFQSLAPGQQRVFRVTGTMPGMGSYSLVDVEIAIIGGPGAALEGGYTNLFFVDADSLLYVADAEISDGAFRAFNNDGGLWLDDIDLYAFAVGARNSGELHVRRSRLTAQDDGGSSIAIQSSGSLYAENSALGPDTAIGLQLEDGAAADLRYVTIAGNDAGVECGSGLSGTVRNSIVASTGATSISACNGLDWVDNGVDELGYGEQIGAYDAAWFVDPEGGDFHLSVAGAVGIGDIAEWDEGDPLVDIDGDLRPTEVEGRPGLDEP
jgi:hypothetical protein